ncbi:MAG: Unknown protein [uncultured Sulfurovum sp.]|uniref:ApeI dehydratase-like domain-containing protein n=1 Tax=uncultured Sulfurovum sp. TaxID=269237 RepID=A0A6S6T5M2_9BACT|nr:MAG: Unknown protein [uncultured Sulfurovum sp.]
MIDDLYTILKEDTQEVVLQLSAKDHPLFQAHFPNNPILPAFALIDILEKVFQEKIVYIKQSKFLVQLLPNDILSCQFKHNENIKNIKIFKNQKKVSEISYASK